MGLDHPAHPSALVPMTHAAEMVLPLRSVVISFTGVHAQKERYLPAACGPRCLLRLARPGSGGGEGRAAAARAGRFGGSGRGGTCAPPTSPGTPADVPGPPITHFITYISAACAFVTRDQPLSSPRQLSAQARSHSQIQGTSTTYLSSAGGRSRLPFEDVLKHRSRPHEQNDFVIRC